MLNSHHTGSSNVFTFAYRPTADIPRSVLENTDAFSEEQIQAFEQLFDDTWHFLSAAEQMTLTALSYFAPAAPVASPALSAIFAISASELESSLNRLHQLRLIEQTAGGHVSLNRLVHHCVSRQSARDGEAASQYRARWLNYYVQFVQKHGDDDVGSEIGYGGNESNRQLEAEIDHIRIAIAWAFEHEPLAAIYMVERITTLLLDTGRWDERIRLCTKSLEIAKQHELIAAQVGFLQRLGWSYLCREDYPNAGLYMKNALSLIRQHPKLEHHPARLPQILRDMGVLVAHLREDNFKAAIDLIEQSESVARYRQLDNSLTLAQIFRAWVLCMRGDSQSAHDETDAAQYSYGQAHVLLDRLIAKLVERKYYRQQILAYRLLAKTLLHLPAPENRLELAHHYLEIASSFAEPFYRAYVQAELSRSWGDWYMAVGNAEFALLSYRTAYHLAVVWGMRREAVDLMRVIRQFETREDALSGNRKPKQPLVLADDPDRPEDADLALPQVQSTQHPLEAEIKRVIADLRGDSVREQPTKSEQILNVFLQQPQQEITLAELSPLFDGTYNPEQAARNLIAKLNQKLSLVGCRIEHVTAYQLVSTE